MMEGQNQTKQRRRILSYELKGLPSELVSAELNIDIARGAKPPKGAIAKLLTDALVAFLGPKHPKIVVNYKPE